MSIVILLVLVLECISGFVLFKKVTLKCVEDFNIQNTKVSIIIPARDEETNLPYLLDSLKNQTITPYEVIVVDDFSTDRTYEIAKNHGAEVIRNPELPKGWTGKTWAVWNGYLKSTGDILVFLDTDVRLAPAALSSLLKAREKCGGAISVVPYHYTEKFYERLSLLTYILGIFAFTSPFERNGKMKGLYGSCIITTRNDYEKIHGHDSIHSMIMDDLKLGKMYSEAHIPVENFIGSSLVSFRMYPNGIKSEWQGFSKGAVLGTATLSPASTSLIAFWIVGIIVTGLITPFLLIFRHPLGLPFLIGYLLYTLQMFYFLRYTGNYGLIMPLLHVLSSIFFILVFLHSVYQVSVLGHVTWKGRQVCVGGEKKCP